MFLSDVVVEPFFDIYDPDDVHLVDVVVDICSNIVLFDVHFDVIMHDDQFVVGELLMRIFEVILSVMLSCFSMLLLSMLFFLMFPSMFSVLFYLVC